MKLRLAAALAGGVLALGLTSLSPLAAAPERTVLVAAPRVDPADGGQRRVAVLAGGCFWGMEAVFAHLKGVQSVTAGYAGGAAKDANYDAVSTERTGHAEAIRIVYDPRVISYGTLLRVYFSVAHNPTERNRQGPDTGPSYRSAVFPQTPAQAAVARAYIAQLNAQRSWGGPLVTRLEQGAFYPAEAYHQNFAQRNPNHGYIRTWDAPKMAALKTRFPQLWTPRWAS